MASWWGFNSYIVARKQALWGALLTEVKEAYQKQIRWIKI